MRELNHSVEELLQTILYKSVKIGVFERPDIFWVGCADYADDNTKESDIETALRLSKAE